MERVLLVEHNLLFREGLALLLKWQTGLSSVYASSLAEVQDVLDIANEKPICVILDLDLPDLPDEDSAELLKQLNGLPVVAHIRSHSLEREAKALEAGVDEVVRTVPAAKLIAAVERLIGPTPIAQPRPNC
jgi:DNA-binding NarL/FixJ family response regulator